MQFIDRKKKKAQINITSLVDMLFILLIFVMITSTFKEQPGMELELPESKTYEQTEMKDFVLRILKDDQAEIQFILNTRTIPLDSLAQLLQQTTHQASEPTLTLKADKEIPHGVVVKAMDLARQAGIKKLVIATRIPPEE
ncbi:biopolymer transporter ExbD [candidate division KSB1 bacterium]|nr:biopolymer transporter ExbD [candidate division KSB1 bacterium]